MTRESLTKVQELIDALPDKTQNFLSEILNRSVDDGFDDQGALSRISDPQLFIVPEHSHPFIDAQNTLDLYTKTF